MKTLKTTLLILLTITLFNCGKDNPPPPPLNTSISGISPTSGPKNTIVTINGQDFGANSSLVHVYFNDVEAIIQTVSNTQIIAEVPPRAYTGDVTVSVEGNTVTGPVFDYTISDIQVSTLAGSIQAFADGTGSAAQFDTPTGITMDSQGNLYVADVANHKIRKITPSSVVSTFAGSTIGFADGTGTAAQFRNPIGIGRDSQGNLYVAGTGNHKIRKITPSGVVTTIAGSTLGFADGTGTAAQFKNPVGITSDSQGNLYVADAGNHKIRKITPSGVVTTIAGSTAGFADGTGSAAQFQSPYGIAMSSQGNLYVADAGNHKIRKITPSGVVTTIAGSTIGFADAQGTAAQFRSPVGITIDSQGNLYVADSGNHKIRKITPSGVVTTIAGSTLGFADGTGSVAQFNAPYGIAIDSNYTIYVGDTFNHKVRKITQE